MGFKRLLAVLDIWREDARGQRLADEAPNRMLALGIFGLEINGQSHYPKCFSMLLRRPEGAPSLRKASLISPDGRALQDVTIVAAGAGFAHVHVYGKRDPPSMAPAPIVPTVPRLMSVGRGWASCAATRPRVWLRDDRPVGHPYQDEPGAAVQGDRRSRRLPSPASRSPARPGGPVRRRRRPSWTRVFTVCRCGLERWCSRLRSRGSESHRQDPIPASLRKTVIGEPSFPQDGEWVKGRPYTGPGCKRERSVSRLGGNRHRDKWVPPRGEPQRILPSPVRTLGASSARGKR